MKYYLAPLEGITTYIYRNAYHSMFQPMDKYFTPFIVPRMNKGMNSRERNDILPEHNEGLFVVPQLLTNRAEEFVKTAHKLMEYGYEEINLNLGCPSGTVTAKHKGAGFLAQPEELERFLDEIFSKLTLRISIKTRIGMDSPEEFEHLLEIYNQFPLEELIIHPRVRKDYYKNKPNLSVFQDALEKSKNPVCYNGDIFTSADQEELLKKFPSLTTLMLGRGIIRNPDLLRGFEKSQNGKRALEEFHAMVYTGYQETISGERNVLFKMKELWSYMIQPFSDCENYAKKIRKAENFRNYEIAVNELFRKITMIEEQEDSLTYENV